MLAKVTDADGNGSAIHRTYLTMDGHKANVPTAKKIVGSLPPSSAIRLLPDDSALGIAEGIETALSASVMFDITVWAAISAGGLEKWTPPIGIERVMVFGDNDANGTGQAASWSLAKRLIASGITVTVSIPETTGHDWNDIYLQGIQK
jgi:putative DNA primase/helicase